jgi:hypothetical protein
MSHSIEFHWIREAVAAMRQRASVRAALHKCMQI